MSSSAQQMPGVKRTELQRHDLSIPGREVIQFRVEVSGEASLVRHFHPGEEIIYLLEGEMEYYIDGQPPFTANAGDAVTFPAGVVHTGKNIGGGYAAVLATYLVEKGKPLITVVE
jgi:quercetin dioxygenase-like cupin family protein